MQNYYETNTEEIMVALKARISGLTSNEVKVRLKKYGSNKLPEGRQKSYFQIFLNQFKSPLIYILLTVAIIVFFLRETTDAVIIFLLLLFNAFVGTIQEGKAQNTLKAL